MKLTATIIQTSAVAVFLAGCTSSPSQNHDPPQNAPEVDTDKPMPNKLAADKSQLEDDERKLVEDVGTFGWHVIAVEDDEEGPGFAYTIGLHHSFGHPEIIVFGLRMETLFQIVNTIGEAVKEGTKFEADHESDDVLDDYLVHFRAVEKELYGEYLGYAQWFYNGDGFPALQCVWPDSEGRYPWHPEIDAKFAERQPILGNGADWPFHEGKNRSSITTRQVLEGHPILLVSHDEDGDWQFLCGTTDDEEDGRVVCLNEILELDGSTTGLADLPIGWDASRDARGKPWQRYEAEE
jgi:hypothetical protein